MKGFCVGLLIGLVIAGAVWRYDKGMYQRLSDHCYNFRLCLEVQREMWKKAMMQRDELGKRLANATGKPVLMPSIELDVGYWVSLKFSSGSLWL